MTLKVGAVVYAPKVTVIWDMIKDYLAEQGVDIEPVMYADYKLQIDGLAAKDIDVAWNSPLAHLDAAERLGGAEKFGAMRDWDQGVCTFLATRNDTGIDSIEDLRGKRIGFGATDSPQARLIPIYFLHAHGLEYGKDYEEVTYEVGVGLHGDHVGGELDAMKALMAGEVDACFVLRDNFEAWLADGTADANVVKKVAETPLYDHCIFTAHDTVDEAEFAAFNEALYAMDYDDPTQKEIMDLEGLKEWIPGRTEGFEQLRNANEYLGGFIAQFNASRD